MSGPHRTAGLNRWVTILADRSPGEHEEHGDFFASPVGIVRRSADGRPADVQGGWLEPRAIHWGTIDLPASSYAPNVKDRRAGVNVIADYDHNFKDYRTRDPLEPLLSDWSPENRSTRLLDYREKFSRATVEPSRLKVVDTLGGAYGAAWPILTRVRAGLNAHPHGAQVPLFLRGLATSASGTSAAGASANAEARVGEVPAGLVWDGGRNGLIGAIVMMHAGGADDLGAGREGTPTALASIRGDAHFESRRTPTRHGHVLFDFTSGGTSESPGRYQRIWSSMEPDAATRGVNTELGRAANSWRPWYEPIGWYSLDGPPAGPRDPPTPTPASPIGPDPFTPGGWGPYGPGGDQIPPGSTTGGTGGMGFGPGSYFTPPWVGATSALNAMWGAVLWAIDRVNNAVALVTPTSDGADGTRRNTFQVAPNLMVGTRTTNADGSLNGTYYGGTLSGPRVQQTSSTSLQFSGGSYIFVGDSLVTGNSDVSGNQTVSGNITIFGKATVVGEIDPTALELSDGAARPRAAANRGKLRYVQARRALEFSADGQEFFAVASAARRNRDELEDFVLARAARTRALEQVMLTTFG